MYIYSYIFYFQFYIYIGYFVQNFHYAGEDRFYGTMIWALAIIDSIDTFMVDSDISILTDETRNRIERRNDSDDFNLEP